MDVYGDIKKGEKGAWISIWAYLVLSSLKLTAGWIFASEALTADGFNNVTDIVASVAVLIGLRISRKPPDQDHPYGHLRAETIAALLASFIMGTVGLQVLIAAVRNLWNGEFVSPGLNAGWIALLAAAAMYGIYTYNVRLARRINNQALMAAAKDNRSDALVSLGAAIGIFGSRLGLPWLDGVAAIVVGCIILKTAWEIFTSATLTLTDGFDVKQLMSLRTTVEKTEGVKAIKDIRARIHGSTVLVDVVIVVSPDISLVESHAICDTIEQRMKRKHDIVNVHVHVEPDE
ncbi:cation diffusion facilitator family transporter [Cohnella silvisoli]|uniref:Cation diffusion facilitator family transporter n=1 Tax=Cohnella silvisoli TaxID=2873699 RepID=A0ABV1KW71_9BACL|nr:cation diffusion facilitator family transporter [Cohnella silvisoli]MCD9023699.1 cation diffusion facilitator family transporter [Cohnella silvisoli]